MKRRKITLLIMAASLGSRFDGIKQLEPVGIHGEIITDYSIRDPIEADFYKLVFGLWALVSKPQNIVIVPQQPIDGQMLT